MPDRQDPSAARADAQSTAAGRRSGRRGFLALLGMAGAGALGLAFGRPEAALALYPYECCNLLYNDGPGPWDFCYVHETYIWTCMSGSNYCYCCEASSVQTSAVSCSPCC